MAMIAVPLKGTEDLDFTKPLKNFIKNTYAEQFKPDEFDAPISELNKLRTQAVCRKLDRHASSLEVLGRYHDQLLALEGKLPIAEGQITVNFKWYDAFEKGGVFSSSRKQTASSAHFEINCVLFNIAAMNSQIAALQSNDDDDSLKKTAKSYQQAAGIFKHLTTSVFSGVQDIRTYDLRPEMLQALSAIMVAQAQESFFNKARQDGQEFPVTLSQVWDRPILGIISCLTKSTAGGHNVAMSINKMKDAIITKVASAASDLYAEALKLLQAGEIADAFSREWIPTVAGKQALMHAYSEYHQALVCRAGKEYGQEIARIQHAVTLLNAAETRGGGLLKTRPLATKYQKELNTAKKDNELIYSDVIPDVSSLKSPGVAIIAKTMDPPSSMSENFSDLFEKLVPLSVHNAVVSYENRKAEIVNREVHKLREATQLLNTVLASLNLPAAIEDLGGDSVPQSVMEKSQQLQAVGGLVAIDKLFSELPDLLERNRQILTEGMKELDTEAGTDAEMKEKFKDKWTRTPSAQLTATFRAEGNKYKQILDNAIQADHVVKEKFNSNKQYIEMLSKSEGELSAALPPASAASALRDSPVVVELRELLAKVDAIKTEREVTESEIKNAKSDISGQFLGAMTSEGAINEEKISNDNLNSLFSNLIEQVQDSLKRQGVALSSIQDANTRFTNAKTGNVSAREREETLRKLASAFDTYMELTANLKEGTKFYNDLTQLLVRFQSKVTDFCFARKTEKEELLRDLTTAAANQPSGPAPAAPAHHKGGPPPARPPPPQVRPASAPVAAPRSNPPPNVPPPAMAPPPTAPQPYPVQAYQPMPAYAPYGGYAPMPQPYAGGYQQQPPPPQGYAPYGQAPYGQAPQYPPYNQYPNPYQQQPPPR